MMFMHSQHHLSLPSHNTSLGAPCSLSSLTSRISKDGLAENNRCGSDGPTHMRSVGMDGLKGLLSHKARESLKNNTNIMRPALTERQPLAQVFEAPAWAVPAKGEARLEPICETIGRQSPVDLTSKAHVLIGRSPHCDVQLMHGTSSRRHAMLFHHSNGSCYIVDCGSAHGTFVNGVRIASPSNGGVVVPHKVRRGAIIRFGGPGAPCFVLKSFSFRLNEIVRDEDDEEPDMGELVRRNTRLNALGTTAAATVRSYLKQSIQDALLVTRKRSFDSIGSTVTLDEEEPSCKRIRCSSPPLSPEAPIRLVSPDFASVNASKPRRVHFSPTGPQNFYPSLVTPEESLSSEEDN